MTVEATVRQIRDEVRRGERRAEDVCRASLDRLHASNPLLNAFLTVDDEAALAEARRIDASPERATLPLAGVPVAIKDNICTRGLRTTAGSRILERFVPPYDATVVERLRAAGAVIVGKTNCDEFAMGSSNENSAFGAVANPWAVDRAPGGSSGGSAAAVAARIVPAALGSDTGGSVRQPAAFCGVVGLKPTYGRVSRYGLLAFGSSLDQVGPLGRTVDDVALLFEAIAGRDPRDSTSSDSPASASAVAARQERANGRLVLGVPRRLLSEGVDAAVRAGFDAALDTLSALGATIVDVELPHAHHAIPVYYLIATAEASSNLARYDGVRYTRRAALRLGDGLEEMYDRTREEGFGAEVKRRIVLGTYVLSAGYYHAYYLKAQQVRTLIRRDYEAALDRTSALVLPTSPSPAFRLGEKIDDPLQMYLADVFTVSANLAGVPAISVPCGFSPDGLPIGLQIIGKPWAEASVLEIARTYEDATGWHTASPPVAGGEAAERRARRARP